MATTPSEFDSLGYLQKAKTRDGFFAIKYNISKSNQTVHNCKESLKNFDRFVFAKFGKNSTEQVITDLQKFPQYRQEQVIIIPARNMLKTDFFIITSVFSCSFIVSS